MSFGWAEVSLQRRNGLGVTADRSAIPTGLQVIVVSVAVQDRRGLRIPNPIYKIELRKYANFSVFLAILAHLTHFRAVP